MGPIKPNLNQSPSPWARRGAECRHGCWRETAREGAARTPRGWGGGGGCGSRGLTHAGAVLLHPAHFALAAVSVGRARARLTRLVAGWKAQVGSLLRVNPFSVTATRVRSSRRLRTYTQQGENKTGNRKPQESQVYLTIENVFV